MWFTPLRRMCPLVLLMVSPLAAKAMCCPGDVNVIKSSGSGLGQTQPLATDQSLDPRWNVHAFERDSISYFQISDVAEGLLFIIAKSGDVFWLLPAGTIDAQVALPSDHQPQRPSLDAKEVFRHPDFTLLVSGTGKAAAWRVENRPAMP
ncbi:hypothetical protein [Stenotrophomonas sp.]|uniref:hypothetical protein n=1 Tax=Stenotrophomonas sp. TaxID=69392 RepID=UPI00289E9D85|nr:hypothetical protein [Stenotrophomonas sp.]